MTSLSVRTALFAALCAFSAAAQAQTNPVPAAPVPTVTGAGASMGGARTPTPPLPGPELSRLAVELSRALDGRLYPCPSAVQASSGAVCLYVQGQGPAVQQRIAAELGERAGGPWQRQGALSQLPLRSEALAGAGVSLLDLGNADQLLILGQGVSLAGSTTAADTDSSEGSLYVTPTDLIGVVRVQATGPQTYRLTPQGGDAADITLGQRELTQRGVRVPLGSAPERVDGELRLPAGVLRSIGCVLSPTEGALTVACGRVSVGIVPRRS